MANAIQVRKVADAKTVSCHKKNMRKTGTPAKVNVQHATPSDQEDQD